MEKDKIKETIDKIWPVTKRELEKGVDNTKKMIIRGEDYLKSFSAKSAENIRKMSLNVRREKLYYMLGKHTASLSKNKWAKDKKISSLVKEINSLKKEIGE